MKKTAKKLLAGISSACVLASSIPAVTLSAQAFTYDNTNVHYGDATLDGNVNLNDAVAILQYVALPAKYPLTDDALPPTFTFHFQLSADAWVLLPKSKIWITPQT